MAAAEGVPHRRDRSPARAPRGRPRDAESRSGDGCVRSRSIRTPGRPAHGNTLGISDHGRRPESIGGPVRNQCFGAAVRQLAFDPAIERDRARKRDARGKRDAGPFRQPNCAGGAVEQDHGPEPEWDSGDADHTACHERAHANARYDTGADRSRDRAAYGHAEADEGQPDTPDAKADRKTDADANPGAGESDGEAAPAVPAGQRRRTRAQQDDRAERSAVRSRQREA